MSNLSFEVGRLQFLTFEVYTTALIFWGQAIFFFWGGVFNTPLNIPMGGCVCHNEMLSHLYFDDLTPLCDNTIKSLL